MRNAIRYSVGAVLTVLALPAILLASAVIGIVLAFDFVISCIGGTL